jgi:hypothetical protein
MFVGPHAVHFTAGRGLGQAEHALEVLAAVGPSSDKPFTALQDLVLQHLDSISGFICILLAWDSPRQKLIRRLQQHGCALHVLVIAEPEDAEVLRAQTNEEKPDQFHVLTVGNIKEDLQQLRL